MINVSKVLSWKPPDNWLEIKTIDAHTGGEPLRIIVGATVVIYILLTVASS